MSDEQTVVATQTDEAQSAAPELPKEVQEQLAELERLKAHHTKLLDETKTAKQKAQELEEAHRKAEEDRLRKDGEFQKLYESESEKAARLQQELEETRADFREKTRTQQQREIKSEAIKAVHEIAVDESSLEILAEKVEKLAVYTESGIEYEVGGVKVAREKVVEMLSQKYPRLIKGSGATGGGATGAGRLGEASNTNQAAEAARKRGDLTGFLTANLNT